MTKMVKRNFLDLVSLTFSRDNRKEKIKQKTRLFLFLSENPSELFRPTSFANHSVIPKTLY